MVLLAVAAVFLPRDIRLPRIEVQAPLPLVDSPGKLPRQKLTSRSSCPDPLRRQFSSSLPSSTPLTSPSPSSTLSTSPSPSSTPSTLPSPLSTPWISTSASCGGLLYIRDTLSRRFFLVDTGAMISVFPHRSPVSTATTLRAAGGQPILSWGKRTLPLSFSSSSGGTHRFDWDFTLAAVDPWRRLLVTPSVRCEYRPPSAGLSGW